MNIAQRIGGVGCVFGKYMHNPFGIVSNFDRFVQRRIYLQCNRRRVLKMDADGPDDTCYQAQEHCARAHFGKLQQDALTVTQNAPPNSSKFEGSLPKAQAPCARRVLASLGHTQKQ